MMPKRLRRFVMFGALTAAIMLVAVTILTANRGTQAASTVAVPAPLAVGTALQQLRTVPNLHLIDEQDRPFSVEDWRGKWVILAPER
jgi:cytochrome oxidase Cu insertion factor (SCO1/SenC/PrrC family)